MNDDQKKAVESLITQNKVLESLIIEMQYELALYKEVSKAAKYFWTHQYADLLTKQIAGNTLAAALCKLEKHENGR